jgi:hypothetical protein
MRAASTGRIHDLHPTVTHDRQNPLAPRASSIHDMTCARRRLHPAVEARESLRRGQTREMTWKEESDARSITLRLPLPSRFRPNKRWGGTARLTATRQLKGRLTPGIGTALINPGKPWQDCAPESLIGKFRDECLSLEWLPVAGRCQGRASHPSSNRKTA